MEERRGEGREGRRGKRDASDELIDLGSCETGDDWSNKKGKEREKSELEKTMWNK